MKSKVAERHCGIELLRIIAMLMVFNLHFFIKGQYSKSENIVINFESWIAICMSVVAVNCYVLISGYFMPNKSFKLSRFTATYSQVWFYSVATFIVMLTLHKISFSFGSLLTSVTPFIHYSYWFVTNYLLLILFSPLLNFAINNMNRQKFKMVLFALVGMYCVFNNAVKLINPFDTSGGYNIVWFIILYLSAAYVKYYYRPSYKPAKYFFAYFSTVALNLAFHSIFGRLGEVWDNGMVRDYNNILVYFGALFLFMAFLNLNIKNSVVKKVVLFISPLTFAVYLIHESPFISSFVWSVFNTSKWCVNSPLFIFFGFGTVLVLFLCCCFIEFLRKLIFKYLKIDFFIKKVSDCTENKVRGLILRSRL